jgi:hypothetical protein
VLVFRGMISDEAKELVKTIVIALAAVVCAGFIVFWL